MIHPTAIVSPKARLGRGLSIGAFTIIHDEVEIGDDSVIDSHCEIGYPTKLAQGRPLIIGKGTLIRSHSVFYAGSTFGDGLVTGHRACVREMTVAGVSLQIGTLTDIQGNCRIGDHVRTHSNVFVAPQSRIGNYVWLFPGVILTNDPHPPSNVTMGAEIGDYVAVAASSVILPGVKVGEHALVAAGSCVTRDVAARTVVGGVPAKFLAHAEDVKLRDGSGRPAYPWPRHFSRGYPEEFKKMWQGD